MNNNKRARQRACAWLATLSVLVLAACGQGGSPSAPAATAGETTLQVSLSQDGTEKAVEGPNLIDLGDRWSEWDGTLADVTYDPATGTLRIGAPATGRDMVIGVRRFEQPLIEGAPYTLTVRTSNPQAAALLFLFDADGRIVPTGAGRNHAIASNGSPFVFTAPAGVAGFFLQVQNQWRATSPTTLDAQLNTTPASGGTGPNLVELTGAWPDWSGRPTTVTVDDNARYLTLPPPPAGRDSTIAVRGFATPLIAGTEYELSAETGSDSQAAVLLFLFDASGRTIPFVGGPAEPARPWIAASLGQPQRFIAPSGVVRFAIQVQGSWQGQITTKIAPALRKVDTTAGSCAPRALDLEKVVTAEHPAFLLGALAVSDDANVIAFTSTVAETLIPNTPGESTDPQRTDVFLFDRGTRRITRVTPASADGSSRNAGLSFDGRYVVFQSEATQLIAGEPDANGAVTDVFVYDRTEAVIRRISTGTSPWPTRLPGFDIFVATRVMSTDGSVILMAGAPPGLTAEQHAACTTDCERLWVVNRPLGTITPLGPEFGISVGFDSAALSGNGRVVVAPATVDGQPGLSHVDLASGIRRRIAPSSGPGLFRTSLSFDGQVIVADGPSSNLLAGETTPAGNAWNAFVADLGAGSLTRLSAAGQSDEWSIGQMLPLSGEMVAMHVTYGSNPLGASEVWIHHRPSGATSRVTPSISEGGNFSYPALSADGRILVTRGFRSDLGAGIFVSRIEYPCASVRTVR